MGEEGNRRISFLRRWDFFVVAGFLLNEIVLAISGTEITKEGGAFLFVSCVWIMVVASLWMDGWMEKRAG